MLDNIRKKLQTMQLGERIGVGYVAVGVLAVLCGIAGMVGVWRLSTSVSFILGPAWSTADGAMEGSIMIQSQMLAADAIIEGRGDDHYEQQLQEAREGTDEAFTRLIEADLVDPQRIRDLQKQLKLYSDASGKLLSTFAEYDRAKQNVDESSAKLVRVSEVLENIGDSQLEALRGMPNTSLTWAGDIQERWDAADGGMESSIAVLTQLYHFSQRLGGANPQKCWDGLIEAESLHDEAMEGMLETGAFDIALSGKELGSQYKGKILSDVYRDAVSEFRKSLHHAFDKQVEMESRQKEYNASADSLLLFVENLEEDADAKVESQKSSVFITQVFCYLIILISLAAAISAALIAGKLCTQSVTEPIIPAVASMKDHTTSTVAAIEEMIASIAHIAENTDEAASASRNASDVVRRGVDSFQGLGSAADQIGSIAGMIQGIAEQTNLLALNATIESARAGEAGRGFAVVANEVKELALQTARATEDINQRIVELRSMSTNAIHEISSINQVIDSVDDITQQIRNAVREQNIATTEIYQNVEQTSAAVSAVVAAIGPTAVKKLPPRAY
ncbi:methyl-accepting chemotaxis protein [Stieleria sp. JC731]|uniref:methyl-accepting chemotaxis protein n=1 Tax=Pirellulaceae TaxID=2691357 RepID=UPI001E4ED00B|nr:methyl-accepting chemotaxis protein [Stieleria sp. JC731]MCC9600357.1 methyl-accepting chemotaxis protein [Stieleria sp. JC731]